MEVKPSANPFMQPVSHDYGVKPDEMIEWKVNGQKPKFNPSSHTVDGNFAFLYSRESDLIGGRVPKPAMTQKRLLTTTEFLKAKREEFERTQSPEEHESRKAQQEVPKPVAEDILRAYKHNPKYEDPRFITSNGEYGRKAPSVATLTVDRAGIPQAFSKSFQNIKPQNTSLTTSLTRSTVHKTLDPQFA